MAPSPPGVTVGEQVPVVVEPYPDGDSMDAAMGLLGLDGVPGRTCLTGTKVKGALKTRRCGLGCFRGSGSKTWESDIR